MSSSKPIKLRNVSNSEYILAEDIEWILPHTSLADIVTASGDVSVTTKSDKMPNFTVSVKNSGGETEIAVYFTDDNEYKIDWNEAIVKDWKVTSKKGLKVTMGDTEISSELGVVDDVITVPTIVRRTKHFVVANDLGDTVESDGIPSDDGFAVNRTIGTDRAKEIANLAICKN